MDNRLGDRRPGGGGAMSSTAPARGLSKYELWYGRAGEPVPRSAVAAGDLRIELEGAEIRSVRLDGVELLRGVYMALRDEEWGTVPGELSGYETSRGPDGFTVEFEMTHRRPPVSFAWKGRIEGDRSGALRYEFDGVAETAFRFCRIGFCLLHPPEQCAGQPYRGRSPKGPVQGTLPLQIGPQSFEHGLYWPLFPSLSELELQLASGIGVRLLFEGDLFETEDQRNWTDASFKTYCTPQELGYPFDAAAGQRFRQKVTFEVISTPGSSTPGSSTPGSSTPGSGPAGARGRSGGRTARRVKLDWQQQRSRPPIGFALPRDVDRHSDAELTLLRDARPDHLRVDVVLLSDGWSRRLAGAHTTAGALGCPLEVAAFVEGEPDLDRLIDQLAALPVARLLLFGYGQEMSDPALTAYARRLIAGRGLHLPVIGGTDLWFAELNRAHPDVTVMDGLVYSVTPQVHTIDEESMAQSLEVQPLTVTTGQSFAGGLPLVVSPVTLRPRDAVHVDDFMPSTPPAEPLPFSVDPRQSSLFAAAWTVGSIAALAGAGAASLTYYETVGWRGIVPGDRPLPEAFVSPPPGGAYAMFHVFADVLEMGESTMLAGSRSDRPAELSALALTSGQRRRVLVANLTPAPVKVEIGPLAAGAVSVRMLDEITGGEALRHPLAYRSRAEHAVHDGDQDVSLDLAPFAVARLDGEG
jgi:D-apionolactonase